MPIKHRKADTEAHTTMSNQNANQTVFLYVQNISISSSQIYLGLSRFSVKILNLHITFRENKNNCHKWH